MSSIEVRAVKLSSAKLKALSPRERYVFALVGHIFNDLVTLMRMTEVTKPNPESHAFHQRASLGVVTLMLRMLLGKTFEAIDTLKRHSVARHLEEHYFTTSHAREAWQATLQQFNELDWLRDMRNRHAFHYLKFGQWEAALTDEHCDGAEVLQGRRYFDTFFYWSDVVASLPMLKRVNDQDPVEGLQQLLDEVGALLASFIRSLAEGMQGYMATQLTDPGAVGEAVMLDVPEKAGTIHVPYFFAE